MLTKAYLRKYFLQIRKAISKANAQNSAISAAKNFIKFINLHEVKNIGFYYPMLGEIDVSFLLSELLLHNKNIVSLLPVITLDNVGLKFYPWRPGDELVNNPRYLQLLEPKLQINSVAITPDIIIVPLVAFDAKLNRLGYGAGFYDKAIAFLKTQSLPVTVGYAYECQKYAKLLPVGPHDMQLDYVVTELRGYSSCAI